MSSTNIESRRVRRLPGAVIDQIAAGEVVERPASVVKELVENALDAGSGRVRVEVRGGGRDWIAVTDDGCGMSPEDAALSLERHATSKISAAEDLANIHTFGFRGEALAAIASVSRVRLRSRRREDREALELQLEGSEVVHRRAVGGPPGTRIEVAGLFEGVPARRKFLKSDTTEWGHVSDWLARTALSLPAVHFDIQRDDRPAVSWPSTQDPLDRIAAVVGEADAAAFTPVSWEEGRAGLEGFVTRPERHRSTTAGIYLYVNRRPVKDRVIQHALIEIYRDLLPRGRFPAAVLFLELPTELVDVNVHPAKVEVRFAEPRAVHALVRHGVRAALSARGWLTGATEAARPAQPVGRRFADPGGESPAQTGWGFAGSSATAAIAADGPALEAETGAAITGSTGIRFADLPLLGQLLATYLVLESKEQLLLIDQHAAHERVLFERLRAQWLERGVEAQGLLAPTVVQLEPLAFAALSECAEATLALGFDWEAYGETSVAIRSVPALLADRDPGQLLRNLADELAAAGVAADALRRGSRNLAAADQLFASLACHAARRKGDVLDPIEQRALLDALDAIPWAPCCPHGRPVAVPFELAEIERRFARR
jgi:DNA mismatch repair protein MutL